LGSFVDSERHRNFVGRRRELADFDDALSGQSSHRVMFVHGPGGIGKTSLLLEMRGRARTAGRTTVLLNGREVDPSPDGFTSAIRDADLTNAVLLVDGYEELRALDAWLRQDFLPALAAESVVVLAGRDAPMSAWRADAGWRRVVAIHCLDPFDATESSQLLSLAGVAEPDWPHLMALGRGHPWRWPCSPTWPAPE
jgi:hypothetical protein